jgi:hypothetical protein
MRNYPAYMGSFRIHSVVTLVREDTVEQARPLGAHAAFCGDRRAADCVRESRRAFHVADQLAHQYLSINPNLM